MSLAGKRIIVADSDDKRLTLVIAELVKQGAEVVEMSSVEKATLAIQQNGVDLLMCHIYAKKAGGTYLLAKSRYLSPKLPVAIFVDNGAKHIHDIIQDMYFLGASQVFEDPYDPQTVANWVQKELELSALR